MIKHFEKNTVGRDLAVGDIHGHFSKLENKLSKINFNQELDRLFSVGDLVDRGPESKIALDWIAKPWFHAVQGNHEDMAIRWGKANCQMDAGNYVANGGAWNVANSYEERREFSQAFSQLPFAMQVETDAGLIGIVHAGCPCVSWSRFVQALKTGWVETPTGFRNSKSAMKDLIEEALWSRNRIQSLDDSIIDDVRAVVVGHTPVHRQTSLGNTFFIDTAAWHPRGGEFTLLDICSLESL